MWYNEIELHARILLTIHGLIVNTIGRACVTT